MLTRGAPHCRRVEERCLSVHLPSGSGAQTDESLRRLLPTLSLIPLYIIGLLDDDGDAGLVEHIDPSKVGMAAVGRLTDRS